jgi:uncharacterized protein YndB with AHSA1/START domain
MDDRIERQITIDASLDHVWELVTEPGWWVPTTDDAPIDRTPGSQTVRESEKWGRFPVEVVRIDPQTYAAFRWASTFPGEELRPGNTTLVEFQLRSLDDGVSVTVVESGFAALDASEDVRAAGHASNTDGWAQELDSLKERSERITTS